jgi:hypothetical protein
MSNGFYILQNELSCKLEKPPLMWSKNYQMLHANRLEDKEQLAFGIKFKFKTEFEFKILESELFLNFF